MKKFTATVTGKSSGTVSIVEAMAFGSESAAVGSIKNAARRMHPEDYEDGEDLQVSDITSSQNTTIG